MPNGNNQPKKSSPPAKHKVSVLSVILAIILTIVLIILGTRIILDLNKYFNPLVSTEYVRGYTNDMGSIYYPAAKEVAYFLYKILLYAAFVLPVILLGIFFYVGVHRHPEKKKHRPLAWSYLIFAIWMTLHFLGAIGRFVISQYKTVGIYVILVILVAFFTWLVIALQRRANKHLNK